MIATRVPPESGGIAYTAAVTLAAAKEHLNVLHATDDAQITAFVAAAQQRLEGQDGAGGVLGCAITRHMLDVALPAFPAGRRPLRLPQPPVSAVESVSYLAADGTVTTLASDQWRLVSDTDAPVLVLQPGAAWPIVLPDQPDAVRLRITCGYATVPAPIVAAILLHVGHLYRNRDAVGDAGSPVPLGYDALLKQFLDHGWR